MNIENPLWQFALKLYTSPSVESCCLAFQLRGVSINRLLCCCWAGVEGYRTTEAMLTSGSASRWQEQVTLPVREVRYRVRELKLQQADLEPCYKALRTAELATEQVELAMLYQVVSEADKEQGGILLVKHNLENYLVGLGVVSDPDLLAQLATLLDAVSDLIGSKEN